MGTVTQTRFFRRRFRNALAGSPTVYLPLRRLTAFGKSDFSHDGYLYKDTDILIDGFPRSANSFAEAAFRLAQPVPIKMAHHSHAAAQIIQAAKWNIPSLVLIRDPIEAARSLLMHQPQVFDVKTALSEYVYLYTSIEPWRERFVLAPFDTVTRDFGKVIDAINRRFHMAFCTFQHTPETELAVFDKVDETSRERGTIESDSVESYSPRANPALRSAREAQKKRVQAAITAAENQDYVNKARAIFRKLMEKRDV